jgi:lysophospholipase L1-like esterase
MPIPTIQITGHVLTPSGDAPTKGRLVIRLSQAAAALDGDELTWVAGREEVTLGADGALPDLRLVPNDALTPAGTYYVVDYFVSGWTENKTERWQLTSTPATIDIGAITRVTQPGGALLVAGPRGPRGTSYLGTYDSGSEPAPVAALEGYCIGLRRPGLPAQLRMCWPLATGWAWLTLRDLPADPPAFSLPAGSYGVPQAVTLTTPSIGAESRYTLDGSTPTLSSPPYSGPIEIAASLTLKAIATWGADTSSEVVSAAYVIQNPSLVFAPAGAYPSGSLFGGVAVSCVRSTEATYRDAGGQWQTVAANQLRVSPGGLVVEPAKTQRYPTPSAPAAGTTATLGVGTWIFWVEGAGSQTISAGTAVGTGWGTATAASPVVITITTAGTAILSAVTGSLTRAQLEGTGVFLTSFMPGASRNQDVVTIPASFGADINRWAISGYFALDPVRNWTDYGALWRIGGESGPNIAWLTQGGGSNMLFSVNDGVGVQKYRSIPMVPVSDTGFGTVPRRITCINDNGALSVYVDDVLATGTNQGSGTGLWATAPDAITLGSRSSTSGLGGAIRRFGVLRGSSDKLSALSLTWPLNQSRVGCVGDSITWGSHSSIGYPARLRAALGEPWLVANHGVPSDTIPMMQTRWSSTIGPLHYGRIVFLGGINDIVADGASATTVESRIQQILDAAKAQGAIVIAMTILPWGNAASWQAGKETVRQAVNGWLPGYCAANGITLIDAATDFDDGTGKMKAAYDSGDGLHPGDAGQARLAELVAAAIPH